MIMIDIKGCLPEAQVLSLGETIISIKWSIAKPLGRKSVANSVWNDVSNKCKSQFEWRMNSVIILNGLSTFSPNWYKLSFLSESAFCDLLGVSSDCAQPIAEQVTLVTRPVIEWAQSEPIPSKRQTKADHKMIACRWEEHCGTVKTVTKTLVLEGATYK